ncbi:nuclease HARBI1, partial [Phenoliferia sp. Uapishka_3]
MPPSSPTVEDLQQQAIQLQQDAILFFTAAEELEDEGEDERRAAREAGRGPSADADDLEDDAMSFQAIASVLLAMSVALQEDIAAARASRKRGPRGPYNVKKSTDSLPILLESSERYYRANFRMSKTTFDKLVILLSTDERCAFIFQSKGRKPQKPVYIQLAAFLFYHGRTNAHHLLVSFPLDLGHGSPTNYRRRVCLALRLIKESFVKWPSKAKRARQAEDFGASGFVGVLGAVDGTLIEFFEQPSVDGSYYYTARKSFYGLNVQVIVDLEGHVISYECGWPAAQPDRFVYKHSQIGEDPFSHFDEKQFLIGDRGYDSTPFMMRVWDDKDVLRGNPERERRIFFNQELCRLRIVIENFFGRLKGRWKSLSLLGGRNTEDQIKQIEALIILEEIMFEWGDRPMNGDDSDSEEDVSDEEDSVGDEEELARQAQDRRDGYQNAGGIRQAGFDLRDMIMDLSFP